jgi:hypothetical protein
MGGKGQVRQRRGFQGIKEVCDGFLVVVVVAVAVAVGSDVVGRLVAVARIRAQRSGR